jgi:hypothetical protein
MLEWPLSQYGLLLTVAKVQMYRCSLMAAGCAAPRCGIVAVLELAFYDRLWKPKKTQNVNISLDQQSVKQYNRKRLLTI